MSIVLVVAPHPDDETLGCGGALLRHKAEGDEVHWLIMTCMQESQGYAVKKIQARQKEIELVADEYEFDSVHSLGFPTTELDRYARNEMVSKMADVISHLKPSIIYLPYRNDIHSDHKVTFDVAAACSKSFRYPSIKSVRVYETLSETEQGIAPDDTGFRPNMFIDITRYIDKKIAIMNLYEGEMGEAPFPRSSEVIKALATYRGSVMGSASSEAFMLLREII